MQKFCTNCGAALEENNCLCPKCGSYINNIPVQNSALQNSSVYYKRPEGNTMSILALIFGILGSWLGILFGIIGLCENKSKDSGVSGRSIAGIVLSSIWMVIGIVFTILIFSYMASEGLY